MAIEVHVVERRRYSRRVADTSAVILFNHHTVIGCVVCNISTGGAALEIGPDIYVPDVFDLIIARDMARECRMIWKREARMGVEFQTT